jgi:hypothetical protein
MDGMTYDSDFSEVKAFKLCRVAASERDPHLEKILLNFTVMTDNKRIIEKSSIGGLARSQNNVVEYDQVNAKGDLFDANTTPKGAAT